MAVSRSLSSSSYGVSRRLLVPPSMLFPGTAVSGSSMLSPIGHDAPPYRGEACACERRTQSGRRRYPMPLAIRRGQLREYEGAPVGEMGMFDEDPEAVDRCPASSPGPASGWASLRRGAWSAGYSYFDLEKSLAGDGPMRGQRWRC